MTQALNNRDCSGWFADWDGRFFEDGGLEALRARCGEWAALPDVPEGARMGPPIVRPREVLCVGLNYSDPAEESGMKPPEEPVLFCKTSNTAVGPFDDVSTIIRPMCTPRYRRRRATCPR